MAKILIDNKEYIADDTRNLLDVILSFGLNLPYFCWHPKLGSVGACRQCAIKEYKDETDKRGRIVMACLTPVRDGMRVSLEDPEVRLFREQIIESLMTNHPHDCPTCDEGGHCHLQDMTLMSGHNYRTYRFLKRTHRNQNLGPFINHEMNRCIACYRCVRFYKDYAGGKDLDVYASRNRVYFGRFEDGPLENEFSGNLVEVCPTGVFTDKTLKEHYTRKWDFTFAPSVCNQCSAGCNIIAGERYGTLRVINSRYNGDVNGYFLCDRGRFGYEYMNGDDRIRKPFKRNGGNAVSVLDANTFLNDLKQTIKPNANILGIGSPRASLESNFALREMVGADRFYTGMSDTDQQLCQLQYDILRNGPVPTFTMRETENADAILILGEDLTNTAPMLALAVRQSVRQKPMEKTNRMKIPPWNDKAVRDTLQDETGPLFMLTSAGTKLDDVATWTLHAAPEDIARFGFAIARELDAASPEVTGLPEEWMAKVKDIARILKEAKRPLVISGYGCGSESVVKAASNVAMGLFKVNRKTGICLTFPEANSLGLTMMGGKKLSDAFREEKPDVVLILENDLYRRADEQQVSAFLDKAGTVVALDYTQTRTTRKAHYLIPSGPLAESSGTLVNNEGRAQQFFQVFVPEHSIQPAWRWLEAVSATLGVGTVGGYERLSDFTQAVEKAFPVFNGISRIAPPPGYRVGGQKIARETHRFSGRTAMYANITVHEPKPPVDPDSAMTYTMEGFVGEPPSPEIPFFWAPGWNSPQAINKYQIEIGGHLHGGDPGKRLIEPDGETHMPIFSDVPKGYSATAGQYLLVPLYHIFGSEELSGRSKAIQERAPKMYVAMNEADAKSLGIEEMAEVTISGKSQIIPVVLRNDIPKGMAGLPAGLQDSYIKLPVSGHLKSVRK